MKRLYISLILLFNIFFYGCPCAEIETCKVNSDCRNDLEACYDGECAEDLCKTRGFSCGKGSCITGSDVSKFNLHGDVACKCFEDAVNYQGTCVPTCNGFSQECRDFGENGNYDDCDMELGHCADDCKGEGSCEEGYYCNGGNCELIGYCVSDYNCKDNTDGKTICDLSTNLCAEPNNSDYTKPQAIEDITNSFCDKYFDCNPDSHNQFATLEECKTSDNGFWNNNMNSEMCNVFNSTKALEMVDCADSYVCANVTEDDGFNDCFNEYFMDMCKDGEGKNEASLEIARNYCENLFTCNENQALSRFKGLEDCKKSMSYEAYVGIIYDNGCPSFNEVAFGDYITCLDSLTCEQSQSDCQTEFDLACNQ
jgi:hypothetical protein